MDTTMGDIPPEQDTTKPRRTSTAVGDAVPDDAELEELPLWVERVDRVKRPRTFATVFHYSLAMVMFCGGIILFALSVHALASFRGNLGSSEEAEFTGILGVLPAIDHVPTLTGLAALGVGLTFLAWASCLATDSDSVCGLINRTVFLVVEFALMIALFILAANRAQRSPLPSGPEGPSAFSFSGLFQEAQKQGDAITICRLQHHFGCAGFQQGDCVPACATPEAQGCDRKKCPDCAKLYPDVGMNGTSPACRGRLEEVDNLHKSSTLAKLRGPTIAISIVLGVCLLFDVVCVAFIFPCLQIEDDRRLIFKRKAPHRNAL